MSEIYLGEIRKQLLGNGYRILPNRYKVPVLAGWNAPDYLASSRKYPSETAIVESWERRFPEAKTTGVRLEGGLGAVDCDVDDPLMDALLLAIQAIVPDVHAKAPTRYGSSQWKLALFVRIVGEPFVRLASHKWNGHQVEIFGGASIKGKVSRQFGIYGPHSEGADYIWAEGVPALHDVAPGDLPALTREQAGQICDAFDRLAAAAGWEREIGPDTDAAEQVYDIDEATRFDTDKGGREISYAELCDEHTAYGDLRCASSFMAGREGTDTARCWVFHSPRHDCVAVYVYGDAQTHYPKAAATTFDRIAGHLVQARGHEPPPVEGDIPPEPDAEASMGAKVGWLLATCGYFEDEDRVVRLDATGLDCRVKPVAFDRRHRSWFEPPSGRRKTPIFATQLWELAPQRVNLDLTGWRGWPPRRPRPYWCTCPTPKSSIGSSPSTEPAAELADPF